MGIFKPSRVTRAHCHVPCGIYDPTFAINAAETVAKMVEQIQAMEVPSAEASDTDKIKFHHDLERRVTNKEDHAKKCKYASDVPAVARGGRGARRDNPGTRGEDGCAAAEGGGGVHGGAGRPPRFPGPRDDSGLERGTNHE